MKKTKMRRLFASAIACVVGVATMAAGAVSASATELPGPQPNVNLTLKGNSNTIGGHTFKALKLADYVGVNSTEGKYGVSTIRDDAALKKAIASAAQATVPLGVTVNNDDPMAWLATRWGLESDHGQELTNPYTGEVRDFVTKLIDTRVPPDDTSDTVVTVTDRVRAMSGSFAQTPAETADHVTFTIPNGIYLILDMTTSNVEVGGVPQGSPHSIPMLVSTEVSGVPTAGSTEINVKASDIDTTKKVEGETHNIGDYIHYTINSEIPVYTGKSKPFTFQIVDTLSPQLTYYPDPSKFTVKVGDVTLHEGLDKDYQLRAYKRTSPNSSTFEGYPVRHEGSTPNHVDNGHDDPASADFSGGSIDGARLVFDLSKYINDKIDQKDWSASGKPVTIDFSVVLNANAKLDGEGNLNEIYSQYGGTYCDWFKTPTHEVYVFSGSIEVNKVSNDFGTQLPGVKFQVYKGDKEQGNALLFEKSTKSDATTDYYHMPLPGVIGDPNIITSAGKSFKIEGLADGKYTFVEREAPQGYMIPAGFKFTVEVKHTVPDKDNHPDQATYTYTVTGDDYGLVTTPGAVDNNSNKLHVLNIKSLTQLPATGMVGIVMRVVLGALLIAIALALYFGIRHVQRSRAQGTMAR